MINWTTKAGFSEPLTQREIAKALLNEEEPQFTFSAMTLVVDNHYHLNTTPQALEALLEYIKPSALLSKNVIWHVKESYHFVSSTSKIAKKFGVSSFKAIGTRKKVIGIEVSSLVNSKDESSIHIHKYGNILRAIKRNHPKVRILPLPNEPCQITTECDADLHKLQAEMFNEINSSGILKVEVSQ